MVERIKLAVIGLLAAGCIVFYINLHSAVKEKVIFKNTAKAMKRQLDEVAAALESKEKEVGRINKELKELDYPQKLRAAMTAAQEVIKELNLEVLNLRKTNAALESKNVSLENRLESNSQELKRFIDQTRQSSQRTREMEEALKLLKAKGDDSAQVSTKQKQESARALEDLRVRYAEAVKERDSLKVELNLARKALSQQSSSSQAEMIVQLNASVDEKKDQLRQLEGELAELTTSLKAERERYKSQLAAKDQALAQLKKGAGNLESSTQRQEEFSQLNTNLKNQISQLSEELKLKEAELGRLEKELKEKNSGADNEEVQILRQKLYTQNEELTKINDLYVRLQEQLKKISAIVAEREIEIAAKEKESNQLQSEIAYLRSRLKYWEEASFQAKNQHEQLLGELGKVLDLNTNLQSRLAEVSNLLNTTLKARTDELFAVEPLDNQREQLRSLQSETQDAKARAEQLKKQVEIILKGIQTDTHANAIQ